MQDLPGRGGHRRCGPRDLFHGHLLFVTLRLTMNSAVFLAVIAAFGAIRSPLAIAALPVAVLTGLAFAAADRGVDGDPHQGHALRPCCSGS